LFGVPLFRVFEFYSKILYPPDADETAMRHSKARERIIQTTEAMFSEVGYGGLNVNHVAEKAGVSIGTLYYHFPDGKVSILMAMREQISARYEEAFMERLGEGFVDDVSSFDEGLDRLLDVLINVHMENRLVLAAIESEVWGNLGLYDSLAEGIDVVSLMVQDAEPVLGVLSALLDRYPVEGLVLGDGVHFFKVMDMLIHRYVYLESTFGTREEFKRLVKKITYALLV